MADENKTPNPAPAPVSEQSIPYSRFQAVVQAKNDLTAQLEEAQGQIQSLSEKAATVDTLAGQVEEWKGKASSAEEKFGRWQGIASKLGTTDSEAIEAAEWAYSKLPEADRPDLPAWLDSIKEDPSKAPKVLTPWMQPQKPNPAAPPESAPSKPRTPARGAQPPGAPSSVSHTAIIEARDHAVRTGDWSRYRELMKARGVRTNVG